MLTLKNWAVTVDLFFGKIRELLEYGTVVPYHTIHDCLRCDGRTRKVGTSFISKPYQYHHHSVHTYGTYLRFPSLHGRRTGSASDDSQRARISGGKSLDKLIDHFSEQGSSAKEVEILEESNHCLRLAARCSSDSCLSPSCSNS